MIPEEVLASFRGSKALVTGGTGLIGRQVVDILCGAGAAVSTISLEAPVDPRAKHWRENLANQDVAFNLTSTVDYVFHLAGRKGSPGATAKYATDYLVPMMIADLIVLEACRKNKVTKVVYTSSIGAYPELSLDLVEEQGWLGLPMDLYPGWAKRTAELVIKSYAAQYGLNNFAVVRLANVYGPGDNFQSENAMVIPSLLWKIKRGDNPVVVWGDGSEVRDFIYSRDAAEGIILALHHGTYPYALNIGSGKGYSIQELVDTLHQFLEFKHTYDTTKPSGYPRRVLDICRARSSLGFEPSTSFREGLEKAWQWLEAQG